jgi:hypothetical protein
MILGKEFMKISLLLLLILRFAFPGFVFAGTDMDLRLKFGTAAGAQRLDFGNIVGHGSSDKGTNAQIEVILSRRQDTPVRFLMAFGAFSRRHEGKINDLSFPAKVDYSVAGLSFAPGVRVRINDTWNFEGRIEAGFGNSGKLTLDSPGVIWNDTKKGDYQSISLIAGMYYLFKNTTSRLGLEIGMQEFNGDFEIRTNGGIWTAANVTGRSAIANIVYGIQF